MKGPIILILVTVSLLACNGFEEDPKGGGVFVKGYIDRNGHYHKAHVRQRISTKPDAIKSRNKSRYYYQTRGKYMRKHKK